MTVEVSAKIAPCFQTTYCPVGVHCSVGFAHDDAREKSRLQFWVSFMVKAHATGFYSHATVFAVGLILESDISN